MGGSKSTIIGKHENCHFLEGLGQKVVQKWVKIYWIPDDVSGFQNFETPFWPFYAPKRRFLWNSEKFDFYIMLFTPRTSKKSAIFVDFFHFHDQKSKNVQFEHNLPYTEHYDSVFSGVFICIMDMYRHHFVSGNQIHWFCGKKQKDLNFVLIFPT